MMFRLTEVVKHLLIINGLFFLASISFPEFMMDNFSLYHPYSQSFKPIQLVTHIFMHGNGAHIFMNMFALFIFGGPLEDAWGSKRFLIYYMLTGFGAAALHLGVKHLEIIQLMGTLSPIQIDSVLNGGGNVAITPDMQTLYNMINTQMIGASGAVYGILLGFGMMFPNLMIMIYFLFPIKAKYIVIFYGVGELMAAISNEPDGIAHYAHLGGMLFGWLLIKKWGLKRIR